MGLKEIEPDSDDVFWTGGLVAANVVVLFWAEAIPNPVMTRSGNYLNSVLMVFTIEDPSKKVCILLTHKQVLRQLFLTVCWDLHA